MVLADSGRIARVPPYLGTPLGQSPVSTTGLSPSVARLSRRLVYRELVLHAVPQPRRSFLRRFSLLRFRSPLLAESRLLSFPRGTEMFHFPRFARARLCIQRGVRRHYPPWVSPFGHRRIKAWLAAPRRFSQLPTSFFASCRLGIHRVPFVAWSSFSSEHPSNLESLMHALDPAATPPPPGWSLLDPLDPPTKGSSGETRGDSETTKTRVQRGAVNSPRKTATLAYLRICSCQRTAGRAWWAWVDSNFRPHAYQACALTS